MRLASVAWKELRHRRSNLISGLIAITLGIAVIVGIRTVTRASEHAVSVQLDSLGANVLVLPSRFIDEGTAFDILKKFLQTSFDGGRHERRVQKIDIGQSAGEE